jgi:hypothetical protein
MQEIEEAHALGASILLCVQEFTHTHIQKCVGAMMECFMMHSIDQTPLIFMPLPGARRVMESQADASITCLVVDGEVTVRTMGVDRPFLTPIIERLTSAHPVLGTFLTSCAVQPNGNMNEGRDIPMLELMADAPTVLVCLNESWLKSAAPRDHQRLNVSIQALINTGPIRVLPIIEPGHDPASLCQMIEASGITFRSHGIDETPRVFHVPKGLQHHLLGRRPTMTNRVVLMMGPNILSSTDTKASPHNFAPAYTALQGN